LTGRQVEQWNGDRLEIGAAFQDQRLGTILSASLQNNPHQLG
jgi:hypothetical protein